MGLDSSIELLGRAQSKYNTFLANIAVERPVGKGRGINKRNRLKIEATLRLATVRQTDDRLAGMRIIHSLRSIEFNQ